MAKKLRLNREQVRSLCKSQIKSSYAAHPIPSKIDNCVGSFSTV